MGSAALLAAARRGWKTLGMEQFGPAHDKGSSHGQSRIIRRAYYEHPNYVPLVEKAFEAWSVIDQASQKRLLEITGLLQVGPEEGEVIQGVLKSAAVHQLDVQKLSVDEISNHFPVFKLNPDHIGVFEPGAGLLRVEWCVAQMLKMAIESGANAKFDSVVHSIKTLGNGRKEIATDSGTYEAERVIIAAGPWAGQILAPMELNLQVVRKQQHWFQIDRVEVVKEAGFPVFLFETDSGVFYGLPQLDKLGMKVAEHSGGTPIDDPTTVSRATERGELGRCEKFVDDHFQFTRRRLVHDSVCMYTVSPDEHFIVDRHPALTNTSFVAGCSGHGFKFAPVIGEHLVNLVDEQSDADLELFKFLRIERFI